MWDIVFSLHLLHLSVFWVTVTGIRCIYYRTQPIDMHCVKQVLMNQLLHSPLVPFVVSDKPLTGIHVLWQLPAIYAMSDVIFFTLHRLAHTKWLYRHVHRIHHEFESPVPESSLYAHPIEHLFVNVMAVGVPLRVVRADPILAAVWVTAVSANVVITHSTKIGKHLHTLHHRQRTVNYGITTYWMDALFGTLAYA